jgi:two-component system, OmpR family, sensor histidine kinase KdpD
MLGKVCRVFRRAVAPQPGGCRRYVSAVNGLQPATVLASTAGPVSASFMSLNIKSAAPQRAAASRWSSLGLIGHGSAELQLVLRGLLVTLGFTPIVLAASFAFGLTDVHILYLIPVVIAATRYSLLAALSAAFAGTAAAAFFLYAPIYSFLVFSSQEVVALTVFIIVAIITSHLSAEARAHSAEARRSYRELERLYAFSRKLATARAPEEIHAAIQEHVSALVGSRVRVLTKEAAELELGGKLLSVRPGESGGSASRQNAAGSDTGRSELFPDPATGSSWLVRPLSQSAGQPSMLLVELAPDAMADRPTLRQSVDALLDDAIATLERLDVDRAIREANAHQQSEALRDAVIGSASHSLRTPLASILGSASILTAAPPVVADKRLAELAGIIVNEAERLNGDIQKMLDAAMLSASGVKPDAAWVEPTDLINAALEVKRGELARHVLETDYPDDLPLVRADATMIREALVLILDNAARYSQTGTTIRVAARAESDRVTISVEDEGDGLDASEHASVFQKFYRGIKVRDTTRGSGLGLWIANAFVTACGGQLTIQPRAGRSGTQLLMHLQAAGDAEMNALGGADE